MAVYLATLCYPLEISSVFTMGAVYRSCAMPINQFCWSVRMRKYLVLARTCVFVVSVADRDGWVYPFTSFHYCIRERSVNNRRVAMWLLSLIVQVFPEIVGIRGAPQVGRRPRLGKRESLSWDVLLLTLRFASLPEESHRQASLLIYPPLDRFQENPSSTHKRR